MQESHDALRRCRQVRLDKLASVQYLIEIPNSGDGTINKTRITINYMSSANPNQPPDLYLLGVFRHSCYTNQYEC